MKKKNAPNIYIALSGDGFDEICDGWYGVVVEDEYDDHLLGIFPTEEAAEEYRNFVVTKQS